VVQGTIPEKIARVNPNRCLRRDVAHSLLSITLMKRNTAKTTRKDAPTLAELISTVNQLTHDEQLGAYIVADLINSRKVRLEGQFRGRDVVVS
jgi:hypothetical protein